MRAFQCHHKVTPDSYYISGYENQGVSWSAQLQYLHKPKELTVGSKSAAGPSSEHESDKVGSKAGGKPTRKILGTIANHLVVTMADFYQLGFRV